MLDITVKGEDLPLIFADCMDWLYWKYSSCPYPKSVAAYQIWPFITYSVCFVVRRICITTTLQWYHYERDGVSNPIPTLFTQPFIQAQIKQNITKLRVTGLCAGNSPVTDEFPHKLPVTRKMFQFDDVIMHHVWLAQLIAGAVTYFQHIKWETNEMTVSANVLFKLLHNQRKRYVNDTFDWLRSITETVISPFW